MTAEDAGRPRPWYDPCGLGNVLLVAVWLWSILLGFELGSIVVKPNGHTVYPIFAEAGRCWANGDATVYGNKRRALDLDFFRYSPTVAAMFAPFGSLSIRVGDLIWRSMNGAALLLGLAWWFRVAPAGMATRGHFGKMLLLMLPLSATSLHNSQSNPFVLGLLLATAAAAAEGRWWIAAGAVVFASVFKIYPISFALLLAVAFPRPLCGRLVAAIVVAGLLPFLTQTPSYVASQYGEWAHYLQTDLRHHVTIERGGRDIRFLFRVWGFRFDDSTFQAVQLVGSAVAALGVLAASLRGWDARRVIALALGLATAWMTVLGPATEPSTYILLGPSLAWGVVQARHERRRGSYACLVAAYLLFVAELASGAFPAGRAFRHLGILPLAGVLTTAGLIRLAQGVERKARSADSAWITRPHRPTSARSSARSLGE